MHTYAMLDNLNISILNNTLQWGGLKNLRQNKLHDPHTGTPMSSHGSDLHLHLVTSANGVWCHHDTVIISRWLLSADLGDDAWIYCTITPSSHNAATVALPDRYPTD
jgi:hypothetical protein